MMKSRKAKISKTAFSLMVIAVSVSFIWFISMVVMLKEEPVTPPVSEDIIEPLPFPTEPVEPIIIPVEPKEETEYIETVIDDNNYIYPFSTMSTDWGAEVYESGFKYYQLPKKYVNTGGCFPEVVQVYLWCLCQEKNIDYYMVVAMIERESGYKWNALNSAGTTKGFMQIDERWHKSRMQAEGVDDLYNPYGNIRVGLNFLQELIGKYGEDYHRVLMSYNMGETGCKNANNRGIYSTDYSRYILQRAEELKQEIQE